MGIYKDHGVSEGSWQQSLKSCQRIIPSGYNIKTVNAKLIKASDAWEDNTALLIIPGGRARAYLAQLGQAGNQRIIDFVHQGGK